jgi:hypothetical protein
MTRWDVSGTAQRGVPASPARAASAPTSGDSTISVAQVSRAGIAPAVSATGTETTKTNGVTRAPALVCFRTW